MPSALATWQRAFRRPSGARPGPSLRPSGTPPPGVPHAPGDDLARRGAATVDEDHDVDVGVDRGDLLVRLRLGQLAVGIPLPEDRARGDELAGHRPSRGHEPAGVAAEVDDQLRLATIDCRVDRLDELRGAVVREAGPPDVADFVVGQRLGDDLALVDRVAGDRDLERVPALALDEEDDGRPLLAPAPGAGPGGGG